ncbi:SLC13 family permease [Candidatus Chloroploca sp. Khr17]|uniref:SLC13 family permease n=1 Tax=Candidatus Chloroploca sp. Khr17 TaxID=2496869 RepID=UPI00101BD909|nr:SLC13 family permease [Candidatus Chloroploca sp. Khr17]
MTGDILIVLSILLATIILFVSDRLRLDVVALLALLALTLTGILTPAEASAGFGDTVVILIAALFVVGEALLQTGVAASISRWLGRVAGTSELRIMVMLMVVVAPLSAFISSTGTVAIMLPVVVALARRARISPSRLLIPMAYAALIGGMLTLIGTPPNLVASEALANAGRAPFGFFSFTPLGLLVLGVAVIFMALVGRHLLPTRVQPPADAPDARNDALTSAELIDAYAVKDDLVSLRVRPTSPLIGKSVVESTLSTAYDVTLLASYPWQLDREAPGKARAVNANTRFAAGDLLDLQAPTAQAERMATELELDVLPSPLESGHLNTGLLVVEVALTPRSSFLGRSVVDLAVRSRFGVNVLGVQRLGQPLKDAFAQEPLRFGDTLLVAGPMPTLAPLVRDQRYYGDFVIAAVPPQLEAEQETTMASQAPVAIIITLLMLIVMAGGWVPTMTAALLAAVALVLTGCVKVTEVYKRMSWESLVLIAAMLPMATALNKTGGTALIAGGIVETIGPLGPLALIAGMFLLTTIFSQFISNTATAVLMMPIALEAASKLGVGPEPLLMTVAIAASTAFATPIASPVNTLILTPGGYRFADYARAGLPLQMLVLVICMIFVPLLFPF